MRLLAPAALVALALGACSQEAGNDAAVNEPADQAVTGNDPATTDLQINSDAPAVDQAINQTDEESGLDETVGGAANGVSNAAE